MEAFVAPDDDAPDYITPTNFEPFIASKLQETYFQDNSMHRYPTLRRLRRQPTFGVIPSQRV